MPYFEIPCFIDLNIDSGSLFGLNVLRKLILVLEQFSRSQGGFRNSFYKESFTTILPTKVDQKY